MFSEARVVVQRRNFNRVLNNCLRKYVNSMSTRCCVEFNIKISSMLDLNIHGECGKQFISLLFKRLGNSVVLNPA